MVTTLENTVAVLATQSIETYLKRAASYTEAVIEDRDPENLHQMRVNLRRLRTIMQIFAPGIVLPASGREPQVAAIARRLGKLRDLDVILTDLETKYAPDLPATERQALNTVLTDLQKRRRKAYKKAKAELKGDRYKTLKKQLQNWVKNPDCTATARLAMGTVLPDLTLPVVSHLWLQPGWLVGTQFVKGALKPNPRIDSATVDALMNDHATQLHSLRKQVKRVRYQLKTVAEFYGDRLDASLTQLATLQDTLGALQDCVVMEARLHQALPHWQRQLPTLIALLADQRYSTWKQWQKLQLYFLDSQHREDLRQTLLYPGVKAPTKKVTASKASTSTSKKSSSPQKTSASPKKTSTSRQSKDVNASPATNGKGTSQQSVQPRDDNNPA